MNTLVDLYRIHQGKVADRWSAYLHQYDRLFCSLRNRPIRLLEIGIQNGGSLEVWGRYFSNARKLVGCDIDPLCLNLRYDDPRISVVMGDATTDETEQKIGAISDTWDFVIDDGSHQSHHIVSTFARFFPKIADGGMFVAEDLHCSYWREFGGGLADPFSAVAFFKRVADLVNFEHWGVTVNRAAYLSVFGARYGCRFNEAALAQVHSVEFFNSQCVIRKRAASDNMLGPRLVVGAQEQVSKGALLYHGTASEALDQGSNPWSDPRLFDLADLDRYAVRFGASDLRASEARAIADAQSLRVVELERRIAELKDEIAARDRTISDLAAEKVLDGQERQREAGEFRSHLSAVHATAQMRDEQIAALMTIQNTPVARLTRLIERIAKKLFPANSRRRRALARMLALADKIYQHGLISLFRQVRGVELQADVLGGTGRINNSASHVVAKASEFAAWIRANEPSADVLTRQRELSMAYDAHAPLFSVIVPVYKIPSEILVAAIGSVQRQTWQNWELCIAYADIENDDNWALLEGLSATDRRVRITRLTDNGGISRNSNAALDLARGEFIALLDHDDELTPWALHEMAISIARVPDADFLYSDKDSINASGSQRVNPLFKPQWSPEMLYSVNYLTHLNVMRRSIVHEVGGWNPDTDGAQDWDLFFRVAERSRRIERVPGIHYHWRIIAGSTATGIEAKPYAALSQLRTMENRVRRLGLSATVMPNPESGFHLVWHRDSLPEIDLVLHSGSGWDPMILINTALVQLDGQLATVTVVHPADERVSLPTRLPGGVDLRTVKGKAGDTSALALAVSRCASRAVLLIDRGVTGVSRQALQDLVGWVLKHPEIGFASALVLLRDDTVVEAGRIVGEGYRSQPLFQGTPLRHWGPLGGPLWYRNVSAASPTAIAFKRDQLDLASYASMPLAEAVVACCAGALAGGLRGLVSPHARAIIEKIPPEVGGGWHKSMREDPYFHPAFCAASPLNLETTGEIDERHDQDLG